MPPMFSGSGRHRRPRQAPSFVVAAGVTGAGLAIPLLGATAANAADAETWDKVAECESGGLWSTDQGDGTYGGVALDEETWDEYGGTEFAERPDYASRGQQIEIAEQILESEGTDEWADCAEEAGLSADSPEEPDLDPEGSGSDSSTPVPERPYPTPPSDPAPEEEADGSDESEAPSGSADPSEPADPSDSPESGDSSDDSSGSPASPGSGAGDSGSPSADDGDAGEGADDSWESADPAAPGGDDGGYGDGRDDPDEHPSREGDGRDEADAGEEGHRVSEGESLSRIADEYDVNGGWAELYERNRDVVGSDPDLIRPGQDLDLATGR